MSDENEVISISSGDGDGVDDKEIEVLGTKEGELPDYVEPLGRLKIKHDDVEILKVSPSPFVPRVSVNHSLWPMNKRRRKKLAIRNANAAICAFKKSQRCVTSNGPESNEDVNDVPSGGREKQQKNCTLDDQQISRENRVVYGRPEKDTKASQNQVSAELKLSTKCKNCGDLVMNHRMKHHIAHKCVARKSLNPGSSTSASQTNTVYMSHSQEIVKGQCVQTDDTKQSALKSPGERSHCTKRRRVDSLSINSRLERDSNRKENMGSGNHFKFGIIEQASQQASASSDDSSEEEYVPYTLNASEEEFIRIPTLSLIEFVQHWEKIVVDVGPEDTHHLEQMPIVTAANRCLNASDSTCQQNAQYGRLLPEATNHLLRNILEVEEKDTFVDIGHGIGNAVLQAAYTIGCEARGIEVCADRNMLACHFSEELLSRCGKVAIVRLVHGQMELKEHRQFLTKSGEERIKAFCNNFGRVFSDKTSKSGQIYTLDDFIAGLFSSMAPGSMIATLHQLIFTQGTLNDTNMDRKRCGLPPDDNASYYEMEEMEVGKQNESVSWSYNGGKNDVVKVYLYKRVGLAKFLCGNPSCTKAKNRVFQSAFKIVNERGLGERMVVNSCDCGFRTRERRKRRSKNKED